MVRLLRIEGEYLTWNEFADEFLKQDTDCLAVWVSLPEDENAPDAAVELDFLDGIVEHDFNMQVGVIYSPDFREVHYAARVPLEDLEHPDWDDEEFYKSIVSSVKALMHAERQTGGRADG